jgi:hypothetical protein
VPEGGYFERERVVAVRPRVLARVLDREAALLLPERDLAPDVLRLRVPDVAPARERVVRVVERGLPPNWLTSFCLRCIIWLPISS